jgi:aminoglycoside/choline kinase family phosphotransferase
MIMKSRKIKIIDYQGARVGPPAYDVASILWDPYYRLEATMRERLLNYYIEKTALTKNFDKQAFKDSLLTCRLQRHMQALGAYGFLSSVKGKKYFLKYVPEAVRLLKEDVSLSGGTYPVLYELIMGL